MQRDGTWILNFTYSPYGTAIDSAGTQHSLLRYRWTGREYDAETGWYFHRSRYYDPQERRFVQEDPAGYSGGDNLYAYVRGRVLEARDPSGLIMVRADKGSRGAAGGRMGPSGFELYVDGAPVPWGSIDIGFLMDGGATATIGFSPPFGSNEPFDAGRPLTLDERYNLGNTCAVVKCDKVRIHVLPAGVGITRGHDIYIGPKGTNRDGSLNIPVLAHEMEHVHQYESMGPLAYYSTAAWVTGLKQGLLHDLLGIGPDQYKWERGKKFEQYHFEQQGQIVQECFGGNKDACDISPFHPN